MTYVIIAMPLIVAVLYVLFLAIFPTFRGPGGRRKK